MSLILAIEPDSGQAAAVRRAVRGLADVDLVLVDSKDAALATLSNTVPELILLSAILSPSDESALTEHLRQRSDADHVQMITIPLLDGPARQPESKPRGWFGLFKRRSPQDENPGRINPRVFAGEIRMHLERAREARATRALQAEHDRVSVVAAERALSAAPEISPPTRDEAISETSPPAFDEAVSDTSAPTADEPARQFDTIQWSGFSDGFGERGAWVDVDGVAVELLRLLPEFAAAERTLSDRIARLKNVDRSSIARTLRLERDDQTGRLILVSDRVPGVRLSELLARGAERLSVPDIPAALFVMERLLLTAGSLHAGSGVAHLAVVPERIVITPRGEVVIVETALAGAIEATSSSSAWPDDPHTDIAAIALIGISMMLGHTIDGNADLDARIRLLGEVADVAAIRAGEGFAASLRSWFEQALVTDAGQSFPDFRHAAFALEYTNPTKDGGCIALRRTLEAFLKDLADFTADDVALESDRVRSVRARQIARRNAISAPAPDLPMTPVLAETPVLAKMPVLAEMPGVEEATSPVAEEEALPILVERTQTAELLDEIFAATPSMPTVTEEILAVGEATSAEDIASPTIEAPTKIVAERPAAIWPEPIDTQPAAESPDIEVAVAFDVAAPSRDEDLVHETPETSMFVEQATAVPEAPVEETAPPTRFAPPPVETHEEIQQPAEDVRPVARRRASLFELFRAFRTSRTADAPGAEPVAVPDTKREEPAPASELVVAEDDVVQEMVQTAIFLAHSSTTPETPAEQVAPEPIATARLPETVEEIAPSILEEPSVLEPLAWEAEAPAPVDEFVAEPPAPMWSEPIETQPAAAPPSMETAATFEKATPELVETEPLIESPEEVAPPAEEDVRPSERRRGTLLLGLFRSFRADHPADELNTEPVAQEADTPAPAAEPFAETPAAIWPESVETPPAETPPAMEAAPAFHEIPPPISADLRDDVHQQIPQPAEDGRPPVRRRSLLDLFRSRQAAREAEEFGPELVPPIPAQTEAWEPPAEIVAQTPADTFAEWSDETMTAPPAAAEEQTDQTTLLDEAFARIPSAPTVSEEVAMATEAPPAPPFADEWAAETAEPPTHIIAEPVPLTSPDMSDSDWDVAWTAANRVEAPLEPLSPPPPPPLPPPLRLDPVDGPIRMQPTAAAGVTPAPLLSQPVVTNVPIPVEPPPAPILTMAPLAVSPPVKPPIATQTVKPKMRPVQGPVTRKSTAGRAQEWMRAAAAATIVAGLALVGSGYYFRGTTPAAPIAGGAEIARPTKPSSINPAKAKARGSLAVASLPPGADVLVDGKRRGVAPLTISNLPAGSHTVVLESTAGTVRRTVQIEADGQAVVNESIFSGWVAVFAPFELQISEGKRTIGTTDSGAIMLPPGRHELVLTNTSLGYHASRVVEIDPGATATVNITAAEGIVRVSAAPGAEVWIDGHRVGETPLGDLRVPIGTHEIVIKHPQLGERRVTTTVTLAAPAEVNVDFGERPSVTQP